MIDACYLIAPYACFVFGKGLMPRPAYISEFGTPAFHALPQFDRGAFQCRSTTDASLVDG